MGAEELEDALNRATRAPRREVRFGARAKHAVFFSARDEARSLGHDYVGAEHILLALLGEPQGLAAHVLAVLGIRRERVREALSPTGDADADSSNRVEHNSEARAVVERAQAEAKGLQAERVETAHVLLALLAQDGAAVGLVGDLGVEPEQLRERVLAEIAAGHDDYEDFSSAAREVVALAEDEARHLDGDHVDTEHLLLALLRHEQRVARRVLDAYGLTSEYARERVAARIVGTGVAPAGPIPVSERTTRVLALAAADARACLSYVNPEHILLALTGEPDGLAARVLAERGAGPDELRRKVLQTLAAGDRASPAAFLERLTDDAAEVVALAQEEARALKHDHIGSGHILLGLLRRGNNAAARRVAALGITVDQVRAELLRLHDKAERPVPALLPFAPSVRELFRLAVQDARWLEHGHIGAEHLALAIVREVDGIGARALDTLGADGDELRAQALTALGAAWAAELSPAEEELSRKEQWLREAQASHREASTEKERKERAAAVQITESIVDDARAKLLPPDGQDALKTLAAYATEEWLKRQPPPEDPERRDWYRDHCATNIHQQLIHVLFHPALGPEDNPIRGHPGGPDAPEEPGHRVPFSLGF